jgi:hypothetical protein
MRRHIDVVGFKDGANELEGSRVASGNGFRFVTETHSGDLIDAVTDVDGGGERNRMENILVAETSGHRFASVGGQVSDRNFRRWS